MAPQPGNIYIATPPTYVAHIWAHDCGNSVVEGFRKAQLLCRPGGLSVEGKAYALRGGGPVSVDGVLLVEAVTEVSVLAEVVLPSLSFFCLQVEIL